MFSVRLLLCLLVAALALPAYASRNQFQISQYGEAKVAIVVSEKAIEAEQTAAKELAKYLKQITGADINIYSKASSASSMSKIFVGQSAETKKMLGNIDWKTLKHDGIIIKFVGRDLVLAGDRPRGSLYAAYTFLEDYLGCRWWTAKASYIPMKPTAYVEKVNKKHIPPFMYRETYYQQVNHKNLEFASRLKLNGHHQSVPDKFGGHYTILGFVHTFDQFLPAATYFDQHPEWFSLVEGKRIGRQTKGQLCLTNEEMKTEFIRRVMEKIAKDPGAGMISVSQNDNRRYCKCDKCNAVAEEEGGQAGVLIRFVNSVADEVAKKYPEFWVETLVYQYTRQAPKLARPRDNVIVRLCSIECDFATPLNSANNATFYRDLQDWKKMSKRLFIWDYVVDFANLVISHPNWRVLGPNLRIFANNNVVGMFEQGDGFNPDAEFANMKIWVMSKLMWDSSLDGYELMKEFADGYYGPAGKYLIKYLDLVCDAVEKNKTYLGCFIGADFDYLTQRVMEQSDELFNLAEKAVINNQVLLDRVRIERLALDHTWILHTSIDRTGAVNARGMQLPAIADAFIYKSETTGNNYIGEGRKMTSEYYDALKSFAAIPPAPAAKRNTAIPEPAKGLSKKQWSEMQDSKISLHQPGIKSFPVSDELASDGRAVRMPGQYPDWSSQLNLNRSGFEAGTKLAIYVSVKVDLKATTGKAFSTGIYDTLNGNRILDWDVKAEDVKGSGYHDYKLGTYQIGPGWHVYVAGPGDAKQAENVYVDRMFFIKE